MSEKLKFPGPLAALNHILENVFSLNPSMYLGVFQEEIRIFLDASLHLSI
jgi:hypothetical protein